MNHSLRLLQLSRLSVIRRFEMRPRKETQKSERRIENTKQHKSDKTAVRVSEDKMGEKVAVGQPQHWLLKTEPGEWSWEDQAANGGITKWDGVKNKQAQKYLKSMKLNDLCFFYHSGARARRVVGVVNVEREWYSEDDGGVSVDVRAVGEMRTAVDLKEMKKDGGLKDFQLLKQPRLSVVLVSEDVWGRICELGGGFEGDGRNVNDGAGTED